MSKTTTPHWLATLSWWCGSVAVTPPLHCRSVPWSESRDSDSRASSLRVAWCCQGQPGAARYETVAVCSRSFAPRKRGRGHTAWALPPALGRWLVGALGERWVGSGCEMVVVGVAAAEEAASRTVRCVQRHGRRRCPVRLQGRLRQVVQLYLPWSGTGRVWQRRTTASMRNPSYFAADNGIIRATTGSRQGGRERQAQQPH